MISFSKVIKAEQQKLGRQRLSVQWRPLDPSSPAVPEVSAELTDLIARAKAEAVAILENAETEARAVREQARQEGYQAGWDAGYQEARHEVQTAWQAIRQELEAPRQKLQQLNAVLERLGDEQTLAVAAALSLKLYSRLKLERLDVIHEYIQELADTMDQKSLTLFVDPTWEPRLTALQEVLDQGVTPLVVKIDDALAAGTMRIEGETGGFLGGPVVSLQTLLQEVLG